MTLDAEIRPPRRSGRPSRHAAELLGVRIVDRALELFLADGYESTTIEGVARACGTTRRSVMHRFPTKAALFMAAAARFHDLFPRVSMGTSPPGEPVAALRQACRNLLAFALSPRAIAFFRISAAEVPRLAGLSELIIAWDDENLLQVRDIVLDAQRAGAFRKHSAASVATAVIGVMMSNPVNRALLGDPQFLDPDFVDLYFDRMWAIFLAMA